MIQLNFIYSDNCEHCLRMEAIINDVLALMKGKEIPCDILEIEYDLDLAIDLAIEYGLDDLPSLVITAGDNSETFIGDNYSKDRIIGAIESLWEKSQK